MEQQDGSRLSIFDVSDPGHIRFTSTVALESRGAFDVERDLGANAKLVRFRSGEGVAVLDLEKAKHPTLRESPVLRSLSEEEPLGNMALFATSATLPGLRPSSDRETRIIDTSIATKPVLLATIANVRQRITLDETGTTFLLCNEGLTVVRRTDIEEEHEIHEMQMRGN